MIDKLCVDVIHPNGKIVKQQEWWFNDDYASVSRLQDEVCDWYNRQGYGVRYLCYHGDSIEDKGFAPSFMDLTPVLFYFEVRTDDNS